MCLIHNVSFAAPRCRCWRMQCVNIQQTKPCVTLLIHRTFASHCIVVAHALIAQAHCIWIHTIQQSLARCSGGVMLPRNMQKHNATSFRVCCWDLATALLALVMQSGSEVVYRTSKLGLLLAHRHKSNSPRHTVNDDLFVVVIDLVDSSPCAHLQHIRPKSASVSLYLQCPQQYVGEPVASSSIHGCPFY